jgi:hypothetical protein
MSVITTPPNYRPVTTATTPPLPPRPTPFTSRSGPGSPPPTGRRRGAGDSRTQADLSKKMQNLLLKNLLEALFPGKDQYPLSSERHAELQKCIAAVNDDTEAKSVQENAMNADQLCERLGYGEDDYPRKGVRAISHPPQTPEPPTGPQNTGGPDRTSAIDAAAGPSVDKLTKSPDAFQAALPKSTLDSLAPDINKKVVSQTQEQLKTLRDGCTSFLARLMGVNEKSITDQIEIHAHELNDAKTEEAQRRACDSAGRFISEIVAAGHAALRDDKKCRDFLDTITDKEKKKKTEEKINDDRVVPLPPANSVGHDTQPNGTGPTGLANGIANDPRLAELPNHMQTKIKAEAEKLERQLAFAAMMHELEMYSTIIKKFNEIAKNAI